ncbi:MAG: hypothetical protein GX303_08195 [Clostridiales bacterium]|nr:hypothetical protein [Clostridiales bacterium]
MLINIDVVIDGATKGLVICTRTIIPSLFPFMVLSEMITGSDIAEIIGRGAGRLFTPLFKISGTGFCSFLLGALCGFPIGARSAVSLYEQGKLGREETERLIAFSNLTGPAFIIGGIGFTLWKSIPFGVLLYTVQIISAIIVGLLLTLTVPKKERCYNKNPLASPPANPPSLSCLITEGVSKASISILSVCGYVVFFLVMSRVIITSLSGITENSVIISFVYSLFEVGSGSAMSAAVGGEDIVKGAALVAFTVGWSGLSVHFQTMHFTGAHQLSLKRYFYGKLLSGILSAFFVLCAIMIYPRLILDTAPSATLPVMTLPMSPAFTYTVNILFGILLTTKIINIIFIKRNK